MPVGLDGIKFKLAAKDAPLHAAKLGYMSPLSGLLNLNLVLSPLSSIHGFSSTAV